MDERNRGRRRTIRRQDRSQSRSPARRQSSILDTSPDPQAEFQVHPRHSCVHKLCAPVPAALDRETDRQRGRVSPISQPRAARTVRAAIALKEFVQITGHCPKFVDRSRTDLKVPADNTLLGIDSAVRRRARDNLEGNVCPLEQMVLGQSQELELVEAHVGLRVPRQRDRGHTALIRMARLEDASRGRLEDLGAN